MSDRLEQLRSLADGVGDLQRGQPGDEGHCKAADLIRWAVAEIEKHKMTEERWAPVSGESPDVGVSVVGWAGYPIIVKRVLVDGEPCWECDNEEIGQDGWITHFIPIEPFPQFPWC